MPTDVSDTYSFEIDNMTDDTIIDVGLVGDVNGDGYITNADVTRLKAAYQGKIELGAVERLWADVNNSGSITNADITRLKAVYQGKINLNW